MINKLSNLLASFKLIFILMLIVSVTTETHARTVADLMSEDKLRVIVKVQTPEPIVAKQPVKISVELLTDRWFGSGNRIHNFDVENMVKMPLDGQAINGSTRLDGKQWATQLREVTVFPQQAGKYMLPPLIIDVAVNTPDGIVKGEVIGKAITLEVSKPKLLTTIDSYVASDEYQVSVSGQADQDKVFKIGEAVTLTFQQSAKGIPAMMLPVVPKIDIPGVGIYRKKPVLSEINNRGELRSTRIDELNIIFEREGQFHLPQTNFYWWQLATQSLEKNVIPAQSWQVSAEVLATTKQTDLNLLNQLKAMEIKQLANYALKILVLSYLIWLGVKKRNLLVSLYRQLSRQQKRILINQYKHAIAQAQYGCACQLLYQLIPELNTKTQRVSETLSLAENCEHQSILRAFYGVDEQSTRIVENLLTLAFGETASLDAISISESQAMSLLKRQYVDTGITWLADKIELNPKEP